MKPDPSTSATAILSTRTVGKKRLGRWLRRVSAGLTLAVAAYAFTLAHPQPLFAYRSDIDRVHLYARRPIDSRLRPMLRESVERVRDASIFDSTLSYTVVEVGSNSWYRFFNGPYSGAMARHSELGGVIYVPTFDAASGTIRHFDGREAAIVEVVAHEMTHRLMQSRLGVVRTLRLPWWKREGYAEFIAERDSVPLLTRIAAFEAPGSSNDLGIPRRYLEALIAVRYLFQVRKMSFHDLIELRESLPEVWAQIRQR